MSIKLNLFFLSILFLILSWACNKEDSSINQQPTFWDCHNQTTWDSIKIKDSLIGKWEWYFIACYWNPQDANGDEHKGLIIDFKMDNTLDVFENGLLIQSSEWTVEANQQFSGVHINPSVSQLYGVILFCNQEVVFNNEIVDGCSNSFFKIE